mmetsp:Transcript_26523/g.61693  ORF Transcript_26523/g.61693 Transcript_26523/m.61693 type:complete len:475 (-) Transcript_26523:24-1448(-)
MEVFIGRVPPGVGVPEISDLFAPYGATNVRVLDGRGCAFANFESPEYAERAIAELNGYQLGGVGAGLNVKLAAAKTPRGPSASPGFQAYSPGPSLATHAAMHAAPPPPPDVRAPLPAPREPQMQPQVFIGRLPPGVEQREIEEMLTPYGAHSIKLLDGKNCAFASFDTWAAAERVITDFDKTQMRADGQSEGLNVKFADVKGAPKGSQQEPKVFIGGLGPMITEEDIRQTCQKFGTITHSKIFTKNDKSLPCAFVTFASFTEAEVCINTLSGQGENLAAEGKALVVKMADLAKSKTAAPPQLQAFSPMPMRAVPPPSTHTPQVPQYHAQAYQPQAYQPQPYQPQTYQPAFHGSLAPQAPLKTQALHGAVKTKGGDDPVPSSVGGGQGEKVFVGGLPDSVNMEFVWGMMAPFGMVADVKIHRKAGASPCGFVRFAHPEDAEQAVEALQTNGRFTVKFADSKPGQKRGFEEAFRPH